MPKVFRRDCDQCGRWYEGYGVRFCSRDCSKAYDHGTMPVTMDENPTAVDNEVRLEERRDGTLVASVLASDTIRTPEQLMERLDIDTEVWEPYESKARKWDVAMKVREFDKGKVVGEDPRIAELFYVAVSFRLREAFAFDLRPIEVTVNISRSGDPRGSPGATHSLHLGDVHFPNHDPRALNVAYQIADVVGAQIVVEHGDAMNLNEISRWEKDPFRRSTLRDEAEMAAQHFAILEGLAGSRPELHFLLGNHEDRIRQKIWEICDKRAYGELFTMPHIVEAFELENILGIKDRWQVTPYVGAPGHIVIRDKLVCIHGSTAPSGGGSKAALTEYRKFGKSGLSGHTHKRGIFETNHYTGTHLWGEIGCLCDIEPGWTQKPNWQQGLAVVTWRGSSFHLESIRIHDGEAFFRGRRYVGNSKEFKKVIPQ